MGGGRWKGGGGRRALKAKDGLRGDPGQASSSPWKLRDKAQQPPTAQRVGVWPACSPVGGSGCRGPRSCRRSPLEPRLGLLWREPGREPGRTSPATRRARPLRPPGAGDAGGRAGGARGALRQAGPPSLPPHPRSLLSLSLSSPSPSPSPPPFPRRGRGRCSRALRPLRGHTKARLHGSRAGLSAAPIAARAPSSLGGRQAGTGMGYGARGAAAPVGGFAVSAAPSWPAAIGTRGLGRLPPGGGTLGLRPPSVRPAGRGRAAPTSRSSRWRARPAAPRAAGLAQQKVPSWAPRPLPPPASLRSRSDRFSFPILPPYSCPLPLQPPRSVHRAGIGPVVQELQARAHPALVPGVAEPRLSPGSWARGQALAAPKPLGDL